MNKFYLIFFGFIYPLTGFSQVNELTFNHQNINFSTPPRTTLSPMSIKLWDNYNNSGLPSTYGTVLEIYGLSGHQTSQLHFGGWDNSRIRYREAFYAQNTWSNWITLLDSKNNLESSGNLMITGSGNHYLSNGNLGIGTLSPTAKLDVNGVIQTYNKDANIATWDNLKLWSEGEKSFLESNGDEKGLVIRSNGGKKIFLMSDVGVGTEDLKGYKLAVAGPMVAESVKVALQTAWPDYVFSKQHQLKPLPELEKYIQANQHLPEIPSAKETEKDGVNLGEMNAKLLKKIEELTLYMIEKGKELKEANKRIDELAKKIDSINNDVR